MYSVLYNITDKQRPLWDCDRGLWSSSDWSNEMDSFACWSDWLDDVIFFVDPTDRTTRIFFPVTPIERRCTEL